MAREGVQIVDTVPKIGFTTPPKKPVKQSIWPTGPASEAMRLRPREYPNLNGEIALVLHGAREADAGPARADAHIHWAGKLASPRGFEPLLSP